MRLTTKGRYAVTAMIELALHEPVHGRMTLKSIAEHQELSVHYLEQLFAKLRARGLVQGIRGPGGGYRLMHPPEKITIYQIINAVDESVDATRCVGKRDCQDGEVCLTHELWSDLSDKMSGFLNEIKLADVVQSPRVRAVARRQSRKRGEPVDAVAQQVSFSPLENRPQP